MKLENNLYTVLEQKIEGWTACFTVKLNASSFIYQAHFPGEPITPGVCIVQMGEELVGILLAANGIKGNTEIEKIKNVKFLSVLTPQDTDHVIYEVKKAALTDDASQVKAQIIVTSGDELKAKISLVLRISDVEC